MFVPLSTGMVLEGRYRVIKKLGSGGFGVVYQALDENVKCLVAVKETTVNEEQQVRAFEREARLLANLRHPTLPKVMDYFERGMSKYLVMEFIDGDDFGTRLKNNNRKPFEVDKVLEWADKLLAALEELHSADEPIIHRDIKPSNLKLDSKGEIVLLDFGLAKGSAGEMSRREGTLVKGHSPLFSSLEQEMGRTTSPQSDLYSLAATLWTLLTGHFPPDAMSERYAAEQDRLPDPLVLANALNPQVPTAIARILNQAMALNKRERPRSATEMRELLRKAVESPRRAEAERARQAELETLRVEAAQAVRDELLPQITKALQQVEEERARRETAIEESRNEMNAALSKIAELQNRETELLRQLTTQNEEYEIKLKSAQAKFSDLDERFMSLTKENSRLKKENDELQRLQVTQPVDTVLLKSDITTLKAGADWARNHDEANPAKRNVEERPLFWQGAVLGAIAAGLFIAIGFLGVWWLTNPTSSAQISNNSNLTLKSNVSDPGNTNSNNNLGGKNDVPAPVAPTGMVYIRGDAFMMGRDAGAQTTVEKPAHRVSVQPFFMDIYETTNEQYAEFVRATNRKPPSVWKNGNYPVEQAKFPVVGVDWNDANDFAKWAGKRLPSEEEWEFAARGTENYLYPWGNNWQDGKANVLTQGLAEVGQYTGASPNGIYDMVGNAWEWTSSDFKAYPNGILPGEYAGKTNLKTVRGGNFETNKDFATTVHRIGWAATGVGNYRRTGFRCAKDIEK
ncbi:MAG TPA: SUMF1/EgtB/PvdO family nonheme iron enzyme [Pyrinomonadaceae bacterium]|jgi:formylglycine-generating enzyme required for sulfatase activity